MSRTSASNNFTAPFGLARFYTNDPKQVQLGLACGDRIRPLNAADLGQSGTKNLNEFLAQPDWERLAELTQLQDGWLALNEVTLTAPVTPRQVLQTGANYRQHVIELVAAGLTNNAGLDPEVARENAAKMMDDRAAHGEPYFFIGLPACVVGDDVELILPAHSDTHDWELELAIVIGKECFRATRDTAMEHVAGYTIVNDISTREYTFRKDMKEIGSDWYKSKNSPGFLPTGPFLVPAFAVDGSNLQVQLRLNGETKQDANTSDLLFDLPALIAAASQIHPLYPGDLLLTGSPAGNGQHWKRFLQDGDVMEGSISGLGTQIVRCVAEES